MISSISEEISENKENIKHVDKSKQVKMNI